MVSAAFPLPPSMEKIVRRLQQTSDPRRRYEYLLWLAQRLPPLPESARVEPNKVPGCVSQVYVIATLEEDLIRFQGDSDAQLTKGLLAVLIEGMNGLTVAEVLQLKPDFIKSTGLEVSLTPSRANGFYNIFHTMQNKARQYQSIQ